MMNKIKSNSKNEDGQGLVEYALVLVMVAIAVLLILSLLGSRVTLAYAQVIGGLNGDVIDDGAIMLSSDMSVSKASGVCTATMSDIRFMVTDSNGNPLTNQTVTAKIYTDDGYFGDISGTAGGSGIATAASKTVTAGCPLNITFSN